MTTLTDSEPQLHPDSPGGGRPQRADHAKIVVWAAILLACLAVWALTVYGAQQVLGM